MTSEPITSTDTTAADASELGLLLAVLIMVLLGTGAMLLML